MATAEQPGALTREQCSRSSRLPRDWAVRELESHLGVPPERIRLHPPPGMATEQDVVDLEEQRHILCEVIQSSLRMAERILMELSRGS